jgi:poly-gamma-glutamate synthesis protein (capsule biosynthesis protein)
MDMRTQGLLNTLDLLDTIEELTVIGARREGESARIITKNNISFGFLAYTHSLNGIPLPRDNPNLVSMINLEVMVKEIAELRPLCNFLIVSMHWGDEYNHHYNRNQEELAAFLAEHQVDLVLGHHPHVIQPVEYIQRPDGRFMLCYYSLGNLISAQARIPTMLGIMAYIKIKKIPAVNDEDRDSFIFIDQGAIPLVTHYERNWTGFKVYPLYSYTEEILEKHFFNQENTSLSMEYLTTLSASLLDFNEIIQNPFY